MRHLLVAVFVLSLAFPALGQAGTDFNEFGVFFDEIGGMNSITADPDSIVDAYLVLKNPSETGQIRFWSAVVAGHPESAYWGPATILGQPRLGTNEWIPMPGEVCIAFYVFCDEPQLPWLEPVTVLADLQILLLGETDPFELFFVGDLAYSKEVFTGWDQESMVYGGPISGNPYFPVAAINGPAPVSTTRETWDSVKALFR